MEYRQLGTSDLKISTIAFGAWAIGGWMWGGTDESDSIATLEASIELGVTTIDTAAIYRYGLSEEIIGKAVRGKRDKVQVLTKYGLRWDCEDGEFCFEWPEPDGSMRKIYKNARKESVIWECEQSLKRLGIDCIDLYQCHWRDETTPVAETMEAMGQLLKEGKIRAAGVSNFTVEDMEAAREVFFDPEAKTPLQTTDTPATMSENPVSSALIPKRKIILTRILHEPQRSLR